MVFEEPKVEFVKIDMADAIATSGGSVETCVGGEAPSNNCTQNGVFTW